MAIVYRHITEDNLRTFYIGIGKNIKRAKSKQGRNKYWHNIVNKYGYTIEILVNNIKDEDAKELETLLIQVLGKTSEGGTLCNLTDGGEGITGCTISNKHKLSISKANKGKARSRATKNKISKSMLGIPKPRGSNTGSPKKIKAINLIDGTEKDFKSIKVCSEILNLNRPSISRVLRKQLKRTGDYTFKYL